MYAHDIMMSLKILLHYIQATLPTCVYRDHQIVDNDNDNFDNCDIIKSHDILKYCPALVLVLNSKNVCVCKAHTPILIPGFPEHSSKTFLAH